MEHTPILACDVVAGHVMYWHGEWWAVKNNYCHPKSCYAKMGLTNDDFAREHGRNSVMATCKTIGKNQMVQILTERAVNEVKANTTYLSLCSSVELMAKLKVLIEEYNDALDLPERVKLANSNFAIDSALIKRQSHEAMMAVFNQLKNTITKIEKP